MTINESVDEVVRLFDNAMRHANEWMDGGPLLTADPVEQAEIKLEKARIYSDILDGLAVLAYRQSMDDLAVEMNLKRQVRDWNRETDNWLESLTLNG